MGWIQLSNNMIYQRMQKKTTLVKGLKNRNTKAESQELNFIGFTISVWRSTKLAEWGLPGKVSTAWLPPTGPPSPRIRGASQDPPNRRLLHISENPINKHHWLIFTSRPSLFLSIPALTCFSQNFVVFWWCQTFGISRNSTSEVSKKRCGSLQPSEPDIFHLHRGQVHSW